MGRSRSPGYVGGVAGLTRPRVGDRIVLAADVSPWLRPDAETSPQRLFCRVHGRAEGTAEMIPGWPYSIVVALMSGCTSPTAVLVRHGGAGHQHAPFAALRGGVVAEVANPGEGQWSTHQPLSCTGADGHRSSAVRA